MQKSKNDKRYMHILQTLILFYVLLCAMLYFMQRRMMYFPDTLRPALIDGAQLVDVTARDGQKIQSWYFAPSDSTKPVIIYFHGNGGNMSHRYYSISPYLENGYGALLAEYRGYGGNAGEINEEGLYNDARAQLKWLNEEKGC